jgi:amino acid transporter
MQPALPQPGLNTQNAERPPLIRGMGLGSAVLLNILDMIGVGPFVTIPLIVGAMGGPQAMLGWIFGALFAVCDGLVIAELGAAMPQAGGSYNFLKEIYGPNKLGRMLSFLFVWQVSFSAPLSIASGCLGLSSYAGYFYKPLSQSLASHDFHLALRRSSRVARRWPSWPWCWPLFFSIAALRTLPGSAACSPSASSAHWHGSSLPASRTSTVRWHSTFPPTPFI